MASDQQDQPFLDLIVWWMFITWMVRHSMASQCPTGYFGDLCQYQCHCKFGSACSVTTGECFAGCDEGWAGPPTCQIENVALRKSTDQNGDTSVTSGLVVDGDRTQDGSTYVCSRVVDTTDPFVAWWYVDLGKVYNIKGVRIYFRNDQPVNKPRREGVRVYVSDNSLEFNEKSLCYKDVLKMDGIIAPPDILDLKNCSKKGQYVIIYNERPRVDPLKCPTTTYSCWANLEVCEVEVFACTKGTFGVNCDQFCHCLNGTCDQHTGICPGKECREGWMGEQCNIGCPLGRYGRNCNETCGNCRNGEVCDTMFGTCSNGCEAGYDGHTCTQPCPKFRYGLGCLGKCEHCANNTDCDKTTGFCPGRCEKGWHGVRCDQSCPRGSFGPKCDKKCGNCINDDQCDYISGHCPRGCKAGYLYPSCVLNCYTGTFGVNCSEKCNTCKDELCNHITGSCHGDCKSGWTGANCRTPCGQGTFGAKCGMSCDHCRDKNCNHVTGLCLKGCAAGWHNPRCNQKCPPGYYGDACNKTCGVCWNGASCNHETGVCMEGCGEGWNGTLCSQACKNGTFGLKCAKSCGQCRNGTVCNHISGICGSGCTEGFFGPYCVSRAADDGNEVIVQSAVIGGALAFVCLVGIIVIVCIARQWSKKREMKKKEEERSRETVVNYADIEESLYQNVNNGYAVSELDLSRISAESATYANNMNETYYNVGVQLPGVSVDNYAEYVHEIEEDPERYREEFNELKDRPTFMHIEGQKKQNKAKNRFLTTFPYDHSRVVLDKLPGETDSDYINANFIPSIDTSRAYIATQGPNRHTVPDFWRMVWQEHVDRIVMLTNVVEDGKTKCECYWNVPHNHTNLIVTVNNTTEMAKYTVRSITLTNAELSESRPVTQYHFTGWPDHGVPDTLELVAFLKRVLKDSQQGRQGIPLLVHCRLRGSELLTEALARDYSCCKRTTFVLVKENETFFCAGVGRTGTFIGLHALYTHGCLHKRVNVVGFVRKMRDNRMLMVQNVEQYRLLHIALLEAFNYTESTIKKCDFVKRLNDFDTGKSNFISKEFQLLQSTKPVYSDYHYTDAKAEENIDKNRSTEVLAVDKFRPYLNTYIEGTTDYINAAIVPSCKAQGKFIVTQAPLPGTIADFWRLVYDHDCSTIVTLNAPDEEQEKNGLWWPSLGDSVCYGPLKITTTAVKDVGREITEKTYDLWKKDYGESRVVKSYHMAGWKSGHYKPFSIETLLELVDLMEAWKRKCLCDTVAVQCTDGALCCGVFCAVSLSLDGLRLEQEVDIYHVIRRLHVRRPEFIKTIDQYRFVYDVIAEYIESRGIYGNT